MLVYYNVKGKAAVFFFRLLLAIQRNGGIRLREILLMYFNLL